MEPVFSTAELQALRQQFPLLAQRGRDGQEIAYLDAAATSQKPQVVLQALENFYTHSNGAVSRGTHLLADEATFAVGESRRKIAAFFGVSEEEIVWTSGATMAINLVAYAFLNASVGLGGAAARERFALQAGDEIVLSAAEHHANLVPWQQLAQATGAQLRFLALDAEGRLAPGCTEVIGPRTRLVAITHMSNVTGVINDLAPVVAAAHQHGALVLADTCQSAAHLPLNLPQLGVDFAVFSAHKMLGPTGVGALWGRAELLAQMPPFLGGGSMIEEVHLDHSTFLPPPTRFEAGTQPVAQIVGWGAACDFMSEVGREKIAAHERYLTELALPRLAGVRGIKLLGPTGSDGCRARGGVIAWAISGVHPHDVGQFLDAHSIAVRVGHHCAQPIHRHFGVSSSSRASFCLTTTEAEIERLVQALDKVSQYFGVD